MSNLVVPVQASSRTGMALVVVERAKARKDRSEIVSRHNLQT